MTRYMVKTGLRHPFLFRLLGRVSDGVTMSGNFWQD